MQLSHSHSSKFSHSYKANIFFQPHSALQFCLRQCLPMIFGVKKPRWHWVKIQKYPGPGLWSGQCVVFVKEPTTCQAGGRVPSDSSRGWMNFRKFNWVSRSKIGNFQNNGGFSRFSSDSSHSWDMFCHRDQSTEVRSEFPIHSIKQESFLFCVPYYM